MKEKIEKLKIKYQEKIEEELENVSPEDLDLWVFVMVSDVIDKAYKIGRKGK